MRTGRGSKPANEERKKLGEPAAEETEVVAGAGEHGIDRVASSAEQEVATEQPVRLGMPDDWLDPIAPPQLAADRRRQAALLPADEDALPIGVMAAVAAVDVGALDPDAGEPLGLLDLCC